MPGGHTVQESQREEVVGTDTVLPGGKFIKISISQVFRVTDALVSPNKLRKEARPFQKYLTKHRRSRNNRQRFLIDGLGGLKPVGGESEENNGFWRTAISGSREETSPPLVFIPFELSLSDRLTRRKMMLESVLHESLGASDGFVQNRQVSGRLRIYPTGVGVVRINIALQFKESIHVSAVAQIAHDFEQLLFVSPDGGTQACESILLDVIESVVGFLFQEEHALQEARWRPPETTYSIYPYQTSRMAQDTGLFAHLLAAAPDNKENEAALKRRIAEALNTKHWTMENVLALASDQVSLFVIGPPHTAGQETKRKQLLEWLTETSELVWVTAYAEQAFVEQIEAIGRPGFLDVTWLPDQSDKFAYFARVVKNTKVVMQAIDAARRDVRKLGAGVLSRTATDVWKYSRLIRAEELNATLDYIADWLSHTEHPDLIDVRQDLHAIQQSLHSFSQPARQSEPEAPSN